MIEREQTSQDKIEETIQSTCCQTSTNQHKLSLTPTDLTTIVQLLYTAYRITTNNKYNSSEGMKPRQHFPQHAEKC